MYKLKFVRFAVAGVLAAISVAAVTFPVFAATGVKSNCVIFDISADTNASRLTLHCANDSNHYTAGYAGCPAVSIDQIKMWHSQAMAALLAGRKVTLFWNDACGSRSFTGFVITNQ